MEERRESDHVYSDKGVYVYNMYGDDCYELAHHTGYEVLIDGQWLLEYVDNYGGFHYFR